jgi:heme/copper-type cytochrome/quinol oxidase subunit 2
MYSFISFILAHQGDAADPELLHWIKERLDQIMPTGPWAVLVLMVLIIVSIPVFIVLVYLLQQRRRSAAAAPPDQEVQEGERVP